MNVHILQTLRFKFYLSKATLKLVHQQCVGKLICSMVVNEDIPFGSWYIEISNSEAFSKHAFRHLVQMRGTLDNGIHILFLSFFPWVVINYTKMCLEISCCSIFGLLLKILQERMI